MSHKPTSSHHWAIDSDGDFTLQRRLEPIERLEPGMYVLDACPHGMWVVRQGTTFKLPDPLYGVEEDFIARVLATYKHGLSFATMLTGTKGTGKTVTCQKIANSVDQPCIIVPTAFPGFTSFLANIPQPVTVLIDEYEKVFPVKDGVDTGIPMLTLLDGATKGDHQRLYLFTSNHMQVNENLIQRPGRIRYVKHFGNLKLSTIREVVTERVVNREKLEPTVAFIASLEVITLDIVTSVVDEVNIHGDDPQTYKDFVNVKQLVISYDVWEHKKGQEFGDFLKASVMLDPLPENMTEGDTLYFNRAEIGDILTVLDDGTVIVRVFRRGDNGKAIPIEGAPESGERYVRFENYLRKFEFKTVTRRNYGKADAWEM